MKHGSRAGVIRCARDARASGSPVGFKRDARLADGVLFSQGFAVILYPAYRPGESASRTWKKFQEKASLFGVTLERIGDADGPPDAVRGIGSPTALGLLCEHVLCRDSHFDAPTSVVYASGSGPEKTRTRPKGPNYLAADERERRADKLDRPTKLPHPPSFWGDGLPVSCGMPDQWAGSGI